MSPRISVILPVYNGEKYLKEAVESILGQTFQDFELIIVDDGSSDGTPAILDTFSDPRIVRLKNERNSGLIAALNSGLRAARGEYIARMDADDQSKNSRLEKQIAYLDRHPEVGVLGTGMEQIDASGKYISTFDVPKDHRQILMKMLSGTALAHASVMMRRCVLTEAGGYDPDFPHTEDTELWSRLIFKTRFANLPEALYVRRLHSGSIMSRHSKFQEKRSRQIRERLQADATQKNIFSPAELAKIRNLDESKNRALKNTIQELKHLLPAPLRHKWAMSAVGKYFKRFIE